MQVNEAIAPVLRGGHAVLFGSLPAGLALPVSDVDVVLIEDNPTTPLPTAAGYEKNDRKAVACQLRQVQPLVTASAASAATVTVLACFRIPALHHRIRHRVDASGSAHGCSPSHGAF